MSKVHQEFLNRLSDKVINQTAIYQGHLINSFTVTESNDGITAFSIRYGWRDESQGWDLTAPIKITQLDQSRYQLSYTIGNNNNKPLTMEIRFK